MAANDVLVVCFDPVAPTNPRRAVTFTRIQRSGLKWSSGVPGGDLRASWTVKCDYLSQVGFPAPRARVLIWDPVRATYLWRGVLRTPKPSYERGQLVEASFDAVGCAEGSFRQFPSTTVFGVTDVLSTVDGRQEVLSLGDVMKFGLTITPLIDGSQADIAGGGTLTEDTKDYKGQTSPQLWEDICNLTLGFEPPFIWLVEPDAAGDAALRFLEQPTSPFYFEHGQAKRNDLEFDSGEIANLIYVVFGGHNTIEVPDVDHGGEPVDYTNTPDIQTHFVNVSEDLREFASAEGFAGALLTKFNQRVVTGGRITLDRDIRIQGNLVVPIQEVRAGRVIQTSITKLPYLNDVVSNSLISQAEYDEDACQVTLSPAALNALGKDARMLAIRGEQSKMTWAWTSRALTSPAPDVAKYSRSDHSQSFFSGFYVNGWTQPSVPSISGGFESGFGVTRPEPGLPVTAYHPNPLPPPVTHDPPANAKPPPIEQGTVPLVKIRDGFFGIGTVGVKIHKQVLPDDRLNIPGVFGTADEDGNLTAGERLHTDVQEGFFDTLTVSTLNAVAVTVTVSVDVYNWDQAAVRITDAFTITLTAGVRRRFQWDNSDDTHRPIMLYHGDQLIWKVNVASAAVILNCTISGWRDWKEHPVLIGPEWLPGNQA